MDNSSQKNIKNMSEKGLATKLPYIDRAISKIWLINNKLFYLNIKNIHNSTKMR